MSRRAPSAKKNSILRRGLRLIRIVCLTVVLLIAAAFLWLNFVGIPKHLQRLLLDPLEKQQVFLEAGRIRLRGFSELLFERVRFRDSKTQPIFELEVPLLHLNFNVQSLLESRIQPESLRFNHSTLRVHLSATNSSSELIVTNIAVDLQVHPDDRWELTRLTGDLLGSHIDLAATLTNASALTSFRSESGSKQALTNQLAWQPMAQEWLDHLNQIQLDGRPHLQVKVSADGLKLSALDLNLKARVPRANSPWGKSEAGFFEATFGPSEDKSDLKLVLHLDALRTGWGEIDQLDIKSETSYSFLTNKVAFHSGWDFQAQEIRTLWTHLKNPHLTATTLQIRAAQDEFKTDLHFQSDSVVSLGFKSQKPHLSASLSHHHPWALLHQESSTTNFFNFWNHPNPWHGDWHLELHETDGEVGKLNRLIFDGTIAKSTNTASTDLDHWPEASWSRHVEWSGSGSIETATLAKLEFHKASFAALWHPPLLTVSSLDADLKQGSIHTQATVDFRDRLIAFNGNASPALQTWSPFIPATWEPWFSKLKFESNPKLEFQSKIQLPPWDSPTDPWEITDLAQISGNATLSATHIGYGDFVLQKLDTELVFTNQTLQIPSIVLLTTQGPVHASGVVDAQTLDYQLSVESRFNPEALVPLFPATATEGIRFVTFNNPPWVDANLKGNLTHLSDLSAQGMVRATNFTARNEAFKDFTASFDYTNQVILLTNLLCHRGGAEAVSSQSLGIDLRSNTLYITNGFSTADPYAITRIIGPETAAAIDRYRFSTPPSVHVNGRVPYTDIHGTDLYFSVEGDAFSYWRFNIPKITGLIHWQGDRLWITNVHGPFYGGKFEWQGEFTFFPNDEADYSFLARTENINLSALLSDIAPSASSIEGNANAILEVTSANSISINTWKGHGNVEMSDGFLWSIPLFGSFSGIIDTLSPGLGKSRLKSGTATYTIDNAKVQTKDMELQAPAFGLKYKGNVGFDGTLDARAELELLPGTLLLGRIFALAFWPLSKAFETHVTGMIENPIVESVYFPSVLLAPLRPVKTLKELLPKPTNPPAATP